MGNKLDTLPADLKKIAEEMLAEKYPEPKKPREPTYRDFSSPMYEDELSWHRSRYPSSSYETVRVTFRGEMTYENYIFTLPKEALYRWNSRDEMEYELLRKFQPEVREPIRLVSVR